MKKLNAIDESARLTRKYIEDPRFNGALDLTAALAALEKAEKRITALKRQIERIKNGVIVRRAKRPIWHHRRGD